MSSDFVGQLTSAALQLFLVRSGEKIPTEVVDRTSPGGTKFTTRPYSQTDAVNDAALLLHVVHAKGREACDKAARSLGTASLWTASQK